jgi:hypothetical protein
MAYNPRNKLKQYKRIIAVYNEVKEEDIPDTYIVKHLFPKYNIYISYRTWVSIKGLKPSELEYDQAAQEQDPDQLSMF